MARIGGRNLWLAVPAGVFCAGVVGVLAVLATPMVPVAAAWVGVSFHNATNMPPPTTPVGTADRFASTMSSDCRSLYADSLWSELTWTPRVLLSQTLAAPATAETSLTQALAPTVRVTCTWRGQRDASISTTVASVGPDAGAVAQAALTASGFTCSASGWTQCTRTQGEVVEEHVVRGGLWISSVETSWHPDHYSGRMMSRLWP
ncbi:hypothetical protein [Microbacterium sp. CJ88]|uniref:hypothetical protein n=1 Tax=Microbacterium sp. CJ88 TaxID=3445672 RepID=UPI003F6587E3